MTSATKKQTGKKKRGSRLSPVSSIKHYYKIQNLEGILETFSLLFSVR